VTAKDKAGNATTKTVGFSTSTSYADVRALVTAFRAANRLDRGRATALQTTLLVAERARNDADERKALKGFRDIAGTVRDAEVRSVLRRDAQVLIERAGG
jgi:FIMAH domain-containing protein